MKSGFTIRVLLASVLLLAVGSGARAQESVVPGLHAKGYVGLTYSRDASSNIVGQGVGEEISTDVTGALFRPEFISWSSSFAYGHSAASVLGTSTGTSAMAGSFNLLVLPAGSFPLTITYQRTRVGLGQSGLDTITNTDRFSLDWRINRERLPKMAFRYGNDSASSDVPVGTFTASDSHGSEIAVSATDTWKGWNWDAGWSKNTSSLGAFVFDRPATIDQNYWIFAGDVSRKYLADKGLFNYSISRTSSEATSGLLSELSGTQLIQNASTSLRMTDKLTSFGSFQYYRFASEGRIAQSQDPAQVTYVINYPAQGYAGSGGFNYRVHPHISVGDTASYSGADISASTTEQTANYFMNSATINGNYSWRRIIFNGSYALGYSRLTTTRDRDFTSLNNNFSASASWARPWLTLAGGFGISHGADGPLPGSYEDTKDYNFTAESTRLRVGKLRFRWMLQDRDLLGFTGYLNSHRAVWSLALMRRRWEVETGLSRGSGAHQVFAEPATVYQPVPALFGLVLADGDLNSWYISGSGTFRRSLRITGTYRRDSNDFPTNNLATTYSIYEVRMDYRIGKIVINASYGHYLNANAFGSAGNLHGSESRSSADRFRFRIVRTFDLF